MVFDAQTVRLWMAQSVDLLGEQRDEIDRLNVFPVPDGDTGTNLYLTIESAASSAAAATGTVADVANEMAQGALLGARGNSGVITSQILRGFADVLSDVGAELDRKAGEVLAEALGQAADSAYNAVAVPKEGTILSVARGAAEGAALAGREDGAGPTEVITAALEAAREALARTPDQLAVLREAGVVDAGGRGLVVILQALDSAIRGVAAPSRRRTGKPPAPTPHAPMVGYDGPEYEVMYLLDAPDVAVPTLRAQLNDLGDSVVVVGGHGLWNIHVHTDHIGAAIERAVEIGKPHRIKVTRLLEADSLRTTGRGTPTTRALVVVAHGPAIADYLEESGITVVRAPARGRASTAELLDGVTRAHAQDVVLLPSDRDTTPVAEAAAAASRDLGVRAAVVPTRSIVQSLAAVAVHDPEARFDDDMIAMGRAAGATRYGAVTTAAKEAITSAGICQPGDVLGLVDGEIVVIGDDTDTVARTVVDRLVSGGTELITLVVGIDARDEQVQQLAEHATTAHPQLEVEVLPGGQPHWPFILGAE
ncbi:MAG: DAK2 domain-containing protein [Actinobacteria bacterium]|nr:DAK2 domain-containing protein [Actinomycetota bacterium]